MTDKTEEGNYDKRLEADEMEIVNMDDKTLQKMLNDIADSIVNLGESIVILTDSYKEIKRKVEEIEERIESLEQNLLEDNEETKEIMLKRLGEKYNEHSIYTKE